MAAGILDHRMRQAKVHLSAYSCRILKREDAKEATARLEKVDVNTLNQAHLKI